MVGSKVIRCGELFCKVIEEQKKNVMDVTYNTVEISDAEACEIIAKKILEGKKVL